MLLDDPPLEASIGAALGVILGSYLATLLIRFPLAIERHQEHHSRCDSCRRRLAWFELIPIVSYLAQRGRCRHCSAPINCLHPAVELACGAVGAICFATGAPAFALMAWLLLILALFDALYLCLPNRLVAGFAITALIAPPWAEGMPYLMRATGGAVGFSALWLLSRAYRHIRGREGLGGGDAKLFGAIGLWVGPLALPIVMLGASTLGLADALQRLGRGADARSVQLPLGTYLAVATLILIVVKLTGSSWVAPL